LQHGYDIACKYKHEGQAGIQSDKAVPPEYQKACDHQFQKGDAPTDPLGIGSYIGHPFQSQPEHPKMHQFAACGIYKQEKVQGGDYKHDGFLMDRQQLHDLLMKWTTKLCKASEIENGKTRESFAKTRFIGVVFLFF